MLASISSPVCTCFHCASAAALTHAPHIRIRDLPIGGNIIETGPDSYRLATTRARAEQQSLG
jgi:hypothetical protein